MEAHNKAEQNRIEQKYEEKLGMLLRKGSLIQEPGQTNDLNNELLERLEAQRIEINAMRSKISDYESGKIKVLRPKASRNYTNDVESDDMMDSDSDFNDSFTVRN